MIPPRRRQMIKGPVQAARRRLSLDFRLLSHSKRAEEQLRAWLLALRHGRLLCHQSGSADPLTPEGLVIVSPYYGNAAVLECFLAHHHRLGVQEFAFLDLSPEGGLATRLADLTHIAVWRPRAGSDKSLVLHWLNFLRHRYATGRWCLSLNA